MSEFFKYLSNDKQISVIAGPCVFENEEHAVRHAAEIARIARSMNVNFIYKTSFDKANRTRHDSFRGHSFDEAYYGMRAVKSTVGCEVLTDVHEPWQCEQVAADVIQIPAMLSRQTDLLRAAAESGRTVNLKKGQFMTPDDVGHALEKLEKFGAKEKFVTERGTTFGYSGVVVDFRALSWMRRFGEPIVLDCTHTTMIGGLGDQRVIEPLALAAAGLGVAGLFIEVHEDPENAPSDGSCMLELSQFAGLLTKVIAVDSARKTFN